MDSTKEIASRLYLTTRTVDAHRNHIYKAVGMNSAVLLPIPHPRRSVGTLKNNRGGLTRTVLTDKKFDPRPNPSRRDGHGRVRDCFRVRLPDPRKELRYGSTITSQRFVATIRPLDQVVGWHHGHIQDVVTERRGSSHFW